MPFKGKSRRRNGRRRRRGRKNMLPLYKNPNTGQLAIKQKTFTTYTIPTLAPGITSQSLITFNLAAVQNQFPQVFDQFRINYVKCTFWACSAQPGSVANNKSVILYTSVDLDGQNPIPTLETDFLERSNVKQRVLSANGGNPVFHTHGVKPRTAKGIYSGGVLQAYGLGDRKTWLDIRSAVAAPHYGLIFMVAAPDGVGTFKLRCNFTYYLQFRKVI